MADLPCEQAFGILLLSMAGAIQDDTLQEIPADLTGLLSIVTLEQLQRLAKLSTWPGLSPLNYLSLLVALNVFRNGRLTIAGLLLAGSEPALRQVLPEFGWSYQYTPFGDKAAEAQAGCRKA